VKGVLSVTPLSQVYDSAPLPLKVILSPKQISLLVTLAITVGNSFTVTSTVAMLVPPSEVVPVTV